MTRRLVVCADGTWNTPDQQDKGHPSPTNVFKMYQAVAARGTASDGVKQLSYYHAGVGASPNWFEKTVLNVANALHVHALDHNLIAGVTGKGIDDNIKDCYDWLVKNYEDGDDIFLFGFSRGAYTVRSLAGLIRNSGLLNADEEDRVDEAYALYRDRSSDSVPDSPRAVAFRKAHSREVGIKCIGVWDTVGALGLPIHLPLVSDLDQAQYAFHDMRLSRSVEYAFHALAIDERRAAFEPTFWEQHPNPGNQVLEQVWFAGVHSNVGGGYADCGLSDNAFLWMADGAARAGLELDKRYVAKNICNARPDGVLRDSTEPPPIWPQKSRVIADGLSSAVLAAGSVTDVRRESLHPSVKKRFRTLVAPQPTPWAPDSLVDYYNRFPETSVAP